MRKILLIEDESAISEPLSFLLENEGFSVTIVDDGSAALAGFHRSQPDIVLLDLMLPGMSGTEICRLLRVESDVPIIMLTAKSSEIDKVVGLELGADDYVTKPYSARELLARINSLLRRTGTSSSNRPGEPADDDDIVEVDHIRLDAGRHTVTIADQESDLPLKEFDLLELLMRNPGRVLTRGQLINLIWGADYYGDTKTLDVHIKRLRSRIEPNPSSPRYITTVRGVGYRFM